MRTDTKWWQKETI